ncbi:MAG: cytochrome c oxidase assembly factor Coa1 family protein [Verrucomicrobiota bacterium]
MNQEAKKKSPVLKYIGCGCLSLVVVGVIGMVVVGLGIGKALKSNAPYKDSIVAVQANQVAIEALGEPIKPGFMLSGSINVENDGGNVTFSIPVSGPKGSGTITVKGTKAGGVWSYDTWQLKVDGREEVIELGKK